MAVASEDRGMWKDTMEVDAQKYLPYLHSRKNINVIYCAFESITISVLIKILILLILI